MTNWTELNNSPNFEPFSKFFKKWKFKKLTKYFCCIRIEAYNFGDPSCDKASVASTTDMAISGIP